MIDYSKLLLEAGRAKSIAYITLAALVLALLVTQLCVTFLLDVPLQEKINHLKIAFLATLIVTPLLAYELVSLLFKINALEIETRNLATYDPLTSLFSRRVFDELTEHQLKVACREKSSIAVMIADVDSFKKINDKHGHFAGDQTLKLLGKIILDSVRVSDIAGRLGGDEFVFCLPNTTAEGAKILANRLINAANNAEFNFDGKIIKIGLSIGVYACKLDYGYEMNDLFKQADQALYKAKRKGKNRFE